MKRKLIRYHQIQRNAFNVTPVGDLLNRRAKPSSSGNTKSKKRKTALSFAEAVTKVKRLLRGYKPRNSHCPKVKDESLCLEVDEQKCTIYFKCHCCDGKRAILRANRDPAKRSFGVLDAIRSCVTEQLPPNNIIEDLDDVLISEDDDIGEVDYETRITEEALLAEASDQIDDEIGLLDDDASSNFSTSIVTDDGIHLNRTLYIAMKNHANKIGTSTISSDRLQRVRTHYNKTVNMPKYDLSGDNGRLIMLGCNVAVVCATDDGNKPFIGSVVRITRKASENAKKRTLLDWLDCNQLSESEDYHLITIKFMVQHHENDAWYTCPPNTVDVETSDVPAETIMFRVVLQYDKDMSVHILDSVFMEEIKAEMAGLQ